MSLTSVKSWCCHNCMKYNNIDTKTCSVCFESREYVTKSMSLPFHGNEASTFRSEQLKGIFPPGSNNVDDMCSEMWTSLHHACAKCNFSVVQELVQMGADINAKTNKGYTPLHFAIQSKSLVMVEYLLSKGADVNNAVTYHEKLTPLHIAAELELKRIIEQILRHDPVINAVNILGRSSLHFVSKTGNCAIGSILLDAGADLRLHDHHGWTPRQVAEFHQQFEFVKLLLQYEMIDSNQKQMVFESLPSAVWHGPEWDSVVQQYDAKINEALSKR